MRILLTLALLGGCMLGSSSDGMRNDFNEARDEAQVHATESRVAADLPSLISEVDRHSAHMTVILDDMRSHMSSMQDCSGMGTMMNMRDGMQIEVSDHQTTMHAMHDLVTARAESEHHMTVMSGMIGDMDMQLGTMNCGGMW